jgi:hypothetical protein
LSVGAVAGLDPSRDADGKLWLLPNAAERRGYHTWQASLVEDEKQWFAVAFHVSRLLLDAPDDARPKQRREEALRHHAATAPVGPPVIEKAK